MKKIALLLAAFALAHSISAPPAFRKGFDRGAVPVVSRDFIGAEWPCLGAPFNDETCFAGIDLDTMRLHTGP